MCDYDDSYLERARTSEWIRARKEHQCCACLEPIKPGTVYHAYKSLFDSEWYRYAHCVRCWAICEALWANGAGSIDLELNCGEAWQNPPSEVAALAFATPADMKEKAEDAWMKRRQQA